MEAVILDLGLFEQKSKDPRPEDVALIWAPIGGRAVCLRGLCCAKYNRPTGQFDLNCYSLRLSFFGVVSSCRRLTGANFLPQCPRTNLQVGVAP